MMEEKKVYETLNGYLEYSIKEQDFESVVNILLRFPDGDYADLIKEKNLFKFLNNFNVFQIERIIRSINNDDLKLRLLNKCLKEVSSQISINAVIKSLSSDLLKVKVFGEYYKYYDSKSFADFLIDIKDSSLRTKTLLLYKGYFPDFKISSIVRSYESDDSKIYIFNKFYDGKDDKEIVSCLYWIRNEEKRKELLNYHINSLTESSWESIALRFHKASNIIDILSKWGSIIPNWIIGEFIINIDDERKRLECMDIFYELIDNSNISNIISSFENKKIRDRALKKYKNMFSQSDWCYIVFCFEKKSEDECKKIIENNINYFSGNLLTEICSDFILFHRYRYNMLEWMLDNYISLFNPVELYNLICLIITHRVEKNIEILAPKLLSKASDKITEKMICNAISLYDFKYFEKNLYNNIQMFSSEQKDLFNYLKVDNPYFFKGFIFELADIPDLLNDLSYFKIFAKYPEIAQKVIHVYKTNAESFRLLFALIKFVFQYDINHDFFVNSLIDSFVLAQNEKLSVLDVSKLDKDDFIKLLYKLINSSFNDDNLIDVDINCEEDIKLYDKVLLNKIDKEFLTAGNLDEAKNALLNKIFGISIKKAQEFIKIYGYSVSKVKDNVSIEYMKIMKKTLEANDMGTLKKIYNTCQPMSLEEKFLFEQNLKKTYNQIISSSLYDIKSKQPNFNFEYNGSHIPFYVVDSEFYLLVNSLQAFRCKTPISNYNKFWNENENIQNHGICCSLISNQSFFKTAPINDVLVGFSSFSDNAIQLANSNDIGTENDKFNMASLKIRFMLAQDFIDNTITDHNELVLERRELRNNINHKYENIQPSYVIVYDTFDDKQLMKSLKAAQELNIPILYLDTSKIVFEERQVIDKYKESLMKSFDIDVFRNLVVRFENNLSNLSLPIAESLPINKSFLVEDINNFIERFFLNMYILVKENEVDKDSAINIFNQIIDVLQSEQDKYQNADLPDDIKHNVINPLPQDELIKRALYYIDLIKSMEDNKTIKTNR